MIYIRKYLDRVIEDEKFMKYEFKGTYKFILGILAIVILASTIIQFNIYEKHNHLIICRIVLLIL